MKEKVRTTVYLDKQLKEEAADTLKGLGYTMSGALDKLMRYIVQEGKMPKEFSNIEARATKTGDCEHE